ncbi:MAG: hypothetical protein R3F31_18995 [Verrucomicrobiales bacterium]
MATARARKIPRLVLLLTATAALGMGGERAEAQERVSNYADLKAPEHAYWTRPLNDPFTRIKADLEAGRLPLDYSSEKNCVISLLKHLKNSHSLPDVGLPPRACNSGSFPPQSPALYFNEEIYLGYIPGGRIEIVSLDPELGAFTFLTCRVPVPLRTVERSNRCMNCHAGDDTGKVPGIVIKSVVPAPPGVASRPFGLNRPGTASLSVSASGDGMSPDKAESRNTGATSLDSMMRAN